MKSVSACVILLALVLCSCESKPSAPAGTEKPGAANAPDPRSNAKPVAGNASSTLPVNEDFSKGSVMDGGWRTVGNWNVVNGAAQNAVVATPQSFNWALSEDDFDLQFTYSIDSFTATDSGLAAFDLHLRSNQPSQAKIWVRFRERTAELGYFDGSAWTKFKNPAVLTEIGIRYNVHISIKGSELTIRRSAPGTGEISVFDQHDAPKYDGDQLSFIAAANTVISLDDIAIRAAK